MIENFYSLDINTFAQATLIFIRISGLLFSLPFFGDSVVPVQARILCSLALTVCLYPLVPPGWIGEFKLEVLPVFGLILKELFLGLSIGYLGKLIFEGLIMAASIVGYQMGFGTANLLLPGSDVQVNAFTALHRIVVLLFFLGLSLHYIFIQGLVQSFELIPAGSLILAPDLGEFLISSSASIFSTAIKLSAPILVALLFTMSALGLVARTVPQMNVFTLSFPLSFFIGLTVYIVLTPFLPNWLQLFYRNKAVEIWNVIFSMAPST